MTTKKNTPLNAPESIQSASSNQDGPTPTPPSFAQQNVTTALKILTVRIEQEAREAAWKWLAKFGVNARKDPDGFPEGSDRLHFLAVAIDNLFSSSKKS